MKKNPLDEIKDESLKKAVLEEIRKREKRRKHIVMACLLLAIGCLGYFTFYSYMGYRTQSMSEKWADLRNRDSVFSHQDETQETVTVHKTGDTKAPDIMPEYKDIYYQNKSLIGWIKIADTNIDYPVMQAADNEYYLTHNFDQQYDKNGCIFMDYQCNVIDRSTDLIIYGHHMKSGNMFGQLDKYASADFWQKHPTFQFDTIYAPGIYKIAYVFRSQVYSEDVITFKYYQFINANSQAEFDSNMKAMADMSLYDTGVTPQYGDQLVTLSTCDHSEEKNGRFVVVGMKIS